MGVWCCGHIQAGDATRTEAAGTGTETVTRNQRPASVSGNLLRRTDGFRRPRPAAFPLDERQDAARAMSMANKDLRCKPHVVSRSCRWYEEPRGIVLVIYCTCRQRHYVLLPWRGLREAVDRKRKK